MVADEWQRKGIAHRLMDALIDTARQRGLRMMEGEVMASNHNMLSFVRALGFAVSTSEDDNNTKLVRKSL